MLQVLRRTIVGCAVAMLLLLQSSTAAAQESPPATAAAEPQVSKSELRKELLARMAKDQEARMQLIELMKSKPDQGAAAPHEDPRLQELQRVDRENREWLKKRIAESGWLGRSLVGDDGAHAAWLLVQHADDDPPFQKECLEKMRAVPKDEVSATDIAYLTDRVMVKETGKQRYGTQLNMADGKFVLVPLEDPDHVDALRKEVGMPPLAEYLEMVAKVYSATPSQDEKAAPQKDAAAAEKKVNK